MFLVDTLHQRGIGVILDWVPSHFPTDEHGLAYFDGTHLYEHADPRQGYHPDWDSFIFNYGRHEVRSFLLSSALFWLDTYHVDGLRVDAVASMLYLDYSRKAGEWIPNRYGGRENLEAIAFLRRLNERGLPGATPTCRPSPRSRPSWPMVSRPTYVGGLGFGFKWDMGWMHDTLEYMARDPIHRKYHHDELTFRMHLRLHARTSCCRSRTTRSCTARARCSTRCPATTGRSSPTCGCSSATCTRQPGKKLLFMGGEFGQWREWNHDASLDWHLLRRPLAHAGVQRWVRDLNRLYRERAGPARARLRPGAASSGSTAATLENSVLSFLRHGRGADARRCWSSSTSRPCRGTTTASACPAPATGARSSTATPPRTAAGLGQLRRRRRGAGGRPRPRELARADPASAGSAFLHRPLTTAAFFKSGWSFPEVFPGYRTLRDRNRRSLRGRSRRQQAGSDPQKRRRPCAHS